MNQEKRDERPQPVGEGHGGLPDAPPLSGRVAAIMIVVLLLLAVLVAVGGIMPRVRARTELKNQTDALAAPNVIANPPQQGKTGQEIILPGNAYAYSDASLYARTDGYLSKWYFDIGAHVRQGQLLAVISSPEVDKQLLQARADLATAEANAGLAKTNSSRYQGLLTQNAVSKQDTDTFVSQAESTSSTVKSAQANVQRLEAAAILRKDLCPLQRSDHRPQCRCRAVDQCGAGTLMFRISAINVLRVYVNVPQIYSQSAVPGTTAAAHSFRISRADIYRQAGAHGEGHRSRLTHPVGRNRCRQPGWQALARGLHRSPHGCASGRRAHDHSRLRTDLSHRRDCRWVRW